MSFFNLLFAQLLARALLVFTNCKIQENVSVMGPNFNKVALSELINKPRSCSASGHTLQLFKLLHECELYTDRGWCNLKNPRSSNLKHLSYLELSEQSSWHPHPRESALLLSGTERETLPVILRLLCRICSSGIWHEGRQLKLLCWEWVERSIMETYSSRLSFL